MFSLCLFLEIKLVKGHIRSIYIKGVIIDSNKLDKHHKQYSKYGKKILGSKTSETVTVSELFPVHKKKEFQNGNKIDRLPKW